MSKDEFPFLTSVVQLIQLQVRIVCSSGECDVSERESLKKKVAVLKICEPLFYVNQKCMAQREFISELIIRTRSYVYMFCRPLLNILFRPVIKIDGSNYTVHA